jgi:hypothetical protein
VIDLKMENVGLSGFDSERPNDNAREIKVRLADLGSGTVTYYIVIYGRMGLTLRQSAIQEPERSQP